MPYPSGATLVERDRAVLASLALARYLSLEQVGRLVFPGRTPTVARRRLARLSMAASGLDPLVRAVPYRKPTGAPGRAFALTEAGYVLARRLVPYAPVPGRDVGAAFLEHALGLNDVLVELALKVRATNERTWFYDLPFRWLCESGESVKFQYYDRAAQRVERGGIRADAILEIGEPRRRLFLECETGSHTLVSVDPTNTGATHAKVNRYLQFFAGAIGQHDPRTPYAQHFPDGSTPALVFLAYSERRRDAIRKVIAERGAGARIKVAAYTLEEAPEVFAAVAQGRPVAQKPPYATISGAQVAVLVRALANGDALALRAATALVARLAAETGAGPVPGVAAGTGSDGAERTP